MTTICAECRWLSVPNAKDQWYRWLCLQAPREQEFNPITGDTVADPPYGRCKDLNHGDCPMFEAAPVPYRWRKEP